MASAVLRFAPCLLLLAWLGCSGARGEPPSPDRAPRDIDELQRLRHDPRACAADADCPTGSHCGAASARCEWACFADSDCGDPKRACDDAGRCIAAPAPVTASTGTSAAATSAATSVATAALAANTASCTALPLAERQAALDDLESNPLTCFDDANCPCGAYCANDATCRFDCRFDAPANQPFCSPGQECSPEGRCLMTSHADDPLLTADLDLASTVITADTAAAAVVVPVEVRLRAKQLALVAATQNATVGFTVSTGEAAGPAARVRCIAGAPWAASCELGAGWTFGADPDPQRSGPRTVWIELPQSATANEWTVTARSEWADGPSTIAVRAAPVVEPPHDTGHFTGTLTWPQPGASPLVLPVTAEVTATRVALRDPSRLLVPSGLAVLGKAASETTTVPWLTSDHPSAAPQVAQALLDLEGLAFVPAEQRLTATVRLTLGNGPAPLALALDLRYGGPTTAPACASGCAADRPCNAEIGLCLAGEPAGTAIVADGVVPSAALASALRESWAPALAGLRQAAPAALGGEDVLGMERAMCFGAPAQTAPGFLGGSNSTPSLDTKCADGTSQDVFPFLDRTSGVTLDGAGAELFNLHDTCLSELAAPTGPPYTAANLLPQRQCVSVARYLLAATAPQPTGGSTQLARRQLQNQLSRQWATLHAMVARSAVREAEFDETLGGQPGQTLHQRLGAVVDTVERDLRALLRERRSEAVEQEAAASPDERTLGRPVLHWTLNQTLDGLIDDVENPEGEDYDLRVSNLASSLRSSNYLAISTGSGTTTTCQTDRDVTLPLRHFAFAAYLGVANPPAGYTLFEKLTAVDGFRVKVSAPSASVRRVEALTLTRLAGGILKTTGSATWDLPAEAGFYALVVDGSRYRLLHVRRNAISNDGIPDGDPMAFEYAPTATTGAGLIWGAAGRLSLGCTISQGLAMFDEITAWRRPIGLAQVQDYAMRYLTAANVMSAGIDSMPPRQLALAATDEQAIGLGAHLVDAAAATLELTAAYLRSERAELYAECQQGAEGAAHQRVYGRAGRALRLTTLLEHDGLDLQALAGSPPAWQARQDAARRLLAGKRSGLARELAAASACENPLGISEDDLPLVHGTAVDASARFFASSRYLASKARDELSVSTSELEAARAAWQAQRASAFQSAVLAPQEKAERLRKLENEYEGALRRLCGAPATGTLLAGFRAGALTARNCFLKTEVPGCANAATLPLSALPAQCLRGLIGEQLLAIQGAQIDARNAENSLDRAIARYDGEMMFCTQRAEFFEENQRIRGEHAAAMNRIRARRRSLGLMASFARAAVSLASGDVVDFARDGINFVFGNLEAEAAADEQREREAHERVMAARAEAAALADCFHEADNQKFAIGAAADVITRTYHDVKAAHAHLTNLSDEVAALVDQGAGDLDLENQMVRVLPHHHYWLDDHLDGYRRHLRYAQRLTYLAVLALEHESQQSLNLRGAVLAARTPGALDQVVLAVEQRNAPMQGEQGYVFGTFVPVMSVRDEILRLGSAAAPAGFPALSAIDSLRAFLRSDAAKLYSGGQYLGKGIRFALRPPPWAQFSCAERLWRVSASLQVDGAPLPNVQLVLYQENSFASQRCRAAERGELRVARVRPAHNLLTGEQSAFEPNPRYTAMLMTGLGNKSREELLAMPEGLHEGLAGRGLYANYVLLFPSDTFDDATLATVRDVLLRLDLVEVTNVGSPN